VVQDIRLFFFKYLSTFVNTLNHKGIYLFINQSVAPRSKARVRGIFYVKTRFFNEKSKTNK